ncbi:PEP-CTERM sorting domain-containing protein [Nitrosomonas oligotropha]|uniref:PEP-CTERM sorting domain-containing protein n=1 Tax=Nitrosomonas oligotropha TaxID=42354 RepID=UPI001F039B3F|nr:PEP-CTERM sorting domain-containing protein [Nitrosomonas oligotropha]
MKNKIILSALTATLLTAAATANATLEPRLSGMAYYDTDTGLTWAAPEQNLTLGLNYFEYESFMTTFSLGGTGGWEIPKVRELMDFAANHSIIIGWGGPGSIPLPPLDKPGWVNWYWVSDVIGIINRTAFSPGMLDTYPFSDPGITGFSVWPVHHGDVPLVAVPEPSTYAMLLAGLGLLGFSLRGK